MRYYVLEINPEPWAVGPLSVGRRNGKIYPYMGRNLQLHAYQQEVKDRIADLNPEKIEGPIHLHFVFYRNVPDATKHQADGTNLCKATEDALQGILFDNDRDVESCVWVIGAQGPDVHPLLVVGITGDKFATTLPHAVWGQINALQSQLPAEQSANDWNGGEF